MNELASSERSELTEREAELHEQIADLEAASASLRAHLAELEAAVAEGFQSVFGTVSAKFSEVVSLLFPGGEGRLQLVMDEEGGDPGVEIQVVPAGKRPRALALLSGGERSLVALGFCLALATSRKAPFYLLDEVEAALDDVNLRRFLGVVRRLAEDTQFVLVTHQQPTVEISDTLFGVTMNDGVSQVLARLRFSDPRLLALMGGERVMFESPLLQEMMAKARRKDVLMVLRERFGSVPVDVSELLEVVTTEKALDRLVKKAVACPSIDAFRDHLLS